MKPTNLISCVIQTQTTKVHHVVHNVHPSVTAAAVSTTMLDFCFYFPHLVSKYKEDLLRAGWIEVLMILELEISPLETPIFIETLCAGDECIYYLHTDVFVYPLKHLSPHASPFWIKYMNLFQEWINPV